MIKIFQFLFILLLFSGCSSSSDEHAQKQLYFFDIAGYFKQQASLLSGKPVLKTVNKNGSGETKKVLIKNWEQELQLFADADINKAAWKNSYKKDSTASVLLYTAEDPELKVRSIKITFKNQQPKEIVIHTQSTNLLYHTTEKLIFIPDSLYQISKHQKVILLGSNNYEISGRF